MSIWRYRYAVVAFLFLICSVGFFGIDHYNAGRADRIAPLPLATDFDRVIPFSPSFVFAYLLYYPWLLLPLAVVRHERDLYEILGAFLSMQLAAAAIFLAVPSYVPRPEISTQGAAAEVLRTIYALDPGWNAFPSLHVGHSVLVALVFWRLRRSFFPYVAVGTGLIAASTVLIKQHYALDILGGAALAWACMTVVTSSESGPLRHRVARSIAANFRPH